MKAVKGKVQRGGSSAKQLHEDYYIVEKSLRPKYIVLAVIFVAAGDLLHL